MTREPLPDRGVLVPLTPVQLGGARGEAVQQMLEDCLAPVALEFRALSPEDVRRLPTVRLNASAQQAMSQVLRHIGPNGPTLYRAVLPQGQALARAAGAGFRGFAKAANGRISAQALLVPAGAGAVAAAAWPLLAVAATTMLFDQIALSQQRDFMRRVDEHMRRAENQSLTARTARLLALDTELRQVVAMMLDGRPVDGTWETARLQATQQLRQAEIFGRTTNASIARVITADRSDFKALSKALDGARTEQGRFYGELDLARASVLVGHRAAVASAAASALADPGNPYAALRPVLEQRFTEVGQATAQLRQLTEALQRVTLKTQHLPWDRGDERTMQTILRNAASRPLIADTPMPVELLALPSGEYREVRHDAESAASPSGTKAHDDRAMDETETSKPSDN